MWKKTNVKNITFKFSVLVGSIATVLFLIITLNCNYSFNVVLEETCNSGIDEDGDGLTDCEDPDCVEHPDCNVEEICYSGIDEDENGLTDCEDPACTDEWFCNEPQPCNEDGVCDSFEDPFWCNDCCPSCEVGNEFTYDYIADEVILARDENEAQYIGVDLNGDGSINNAFGAIAGAIPPDAGDFNSEINKAIINGEFIFLGRLHVSNWPSDEIVTAQVFPGNGTLDATEDNLTGSGETIIDPGTDRSLHLCGELNENMLSTCPGFLQVPIYFLMETKVFPLEKARMVSTDQVTSSVWREMNIGGGLTQESIDNFLLPGLLIYLNLVTIDNPESPTGNFVLNFVDARCSKSYSGCEDVVNEEGDCSKWTEDPDDPPLTMTELKCNMLIRNITELDWDSTGDGEPDLLSFGMRIRAISVTITN